MKAGRREEEVINKSVKMPRVNAKPRWQRLMSCEAGDVENLL